METIPENEQPTDSLTKPKVLPALQSSGFLRHMDMVEKISRQALLGDELLVKSIRSLFEIAA